MNGDLQTYLPIINIFLPIIIDEILRPLIKRVSVINKHKDLNDKQIEAAFIEYIKRTYTKLSSMNVLVFPNQQINIKNIYQPLTIYERRPKESIKIELANTDFIPTYKKVLFSDAAGMGKSTLLKWIGISLLENHLSIPILIELRRLSNNNTLLDEILHQLQPIDCEFDKSLLFQIIEKGKFTILLDGFDEIPYDYREAVVQNIKDFINKAGNNWYILASRPDATLPAFGEFRRFYIAPLTKDDAYNLIKKYDTFNKNAFSSELIEKIEGQYSQVREFLRNPFLVSLLYKAYTFNKDIPSKKCSFYDEVYTALYKYHDLTKDGYIRRKKSNLNISLIHRL